MLFVKRCVLHVYGVWHVGVYNVSDGPLLPQAGMHAVRENRYVVLAKDFEKAYKKAVTKEDQEHEFYK